MQEFREYTAKENINIGGDGSGLYITPVYATYEELETVFNEVGKMIKKLKENKPGGGSNSVFRNCFFIYFILRFTDRPEQLHFFLNRRFNCFKAGC